MVYEKGYIHLQKVATCTFY